MKIIANFFSLLFLLLILLLVGSFVLTSQMLDREPLLPMRAAPSALESRIAQRLLSQVNKTLVEQRQDTWLSERELNALGQVASHALHGLSAEVNIEKSKLAAAITLPLARTPFFINVQSELGNRKQADGVEFRLLKIGKVKLPETWIVPVVKLVLTHFTKLDNPNVLEQVLQSSQLLNNRALLSAKRLKKLNFNRDQLLAATSALSLDVEPEKLQQVQLLLNEISAQLPKQGNISLALICNLLMEKVLLKVQVGSEVEWGKASLWGLVINYGNPKFNKLVGGQALSSASADLANRVTLQQRRDLAQHFLYSALLEQLGGASASFAIGELKELSDSVRGGSGFSFADLAADRAGIAFSRALAQPETAWKLMSKLPEVKSEADFFPRSLLLQEQISEEEFEALFRNTRSEAYLKQVKKIDGEIRALPLYR